MSLERRPRRRIPSRRLVLAVAVGVSALLGFLVGTSVTERWSIAELGFLSSVLVVLLALAVEQVLVRRLLTSSQRLFRPVLWGLLSAAILLLLIETCWVESVQTKDGPVKIITSWAPIQPGKTPEECLSNPAECWKHRWAVDLALKFSYLSTLFGLGALAGTFLHEQSSKSPPDGYIDFQVRVDLTVDRTYRVTVQADGYSTASTTFELPEALELFAPKKLGGTLFETVFRGDVRSVLHGARRDARKSQRGVRIRLSLQNAPKLAALPWELLYDRALGGFFALSRNSPIVRSLDRPEPCEALHVTPPLRVLVTVSQPPQLRSLETEKEWQHIQEALRPLVDKELLVLEPLEGGSWKALSERLKDEDKGKVHVFHFIGHGGLVDEEARGALAFEGTGEEPDYVDGETLGKALDDHGIRLAVLNACHGARVPQSEPLAGVAQTLLARGLPAVVAMQDAISDSTAVEFSQSFYSGLADGTPVDEVLSEVRSLLSGLREHKLEWATPVLYLHAQDGHLFDIPKNDPVE